MFSTTTIPLSTNIPSANIKPNNTIIFRVTPIILSKIKDISMDSGIAIPTKRAFRNPKKNKSTKTTKITPIMMLFSRFNTCFFVSLDISLVTDISKFFGNLCSLALAKMILIFSEASIKFLPPFFFTSSITTGFINSLA